MSFAVEIAKILNVDRSVATKDSKKSQQIHPVLKIKNRDQSTIDLIFTDRSSCDIWEDGLKFCIQEIPTSERYKQDLKDLIEMETQVRFSRIDNILDIPNDFPQLKSPPSINIQDLQ